MAANLHAVDRDLPVLSAPDRLRKAGDECRALYEDYYIEGLDRSGLREHERWLARYAKVAPMLPSLAAQVAAIKRPAKRAEIAAALATLRDSIPTGNRTLTANGNRMFADRVGAHEPTIGALNLATLRAIDTLSWFPAPAEFLSILAKTTADVASISNAVERLPVIQRELHKLAEDERQRRTEFAERLRATPEAEEGG